MWTPNWVGIPKGCVSPTTMSAPNVPGGVSNPKESGLAYTINKAFLSFI